MDKAAKLILNSLRCPICKSQIDMLSYTYTKKPRPFNYCCASNTEHYGLWFIHWEQPIRIESETAIVYDGCYQYEIKQQHAGPGLLSSAPKPDYTEIWVREVDAENRIIDNIKPKVFSYYKCLFDFANTTRDKIVLRIKTILVFQ